MSKDMNVLVMQKENELSSLCQLMEELKVEFIKETAGFASEWYRRTTKEYVTKYPEVTLNMKEEKIAQMKAQINDLARNSEKIVNAELDNSSLWWHRKPRLHESIKQYLQVDDAYPEVLDCAVRHVLGRLGLILEEYKFNVSASGNSGSYTEFWFDYPSGSESASKPSYPHLLKWSEKMQDTIRRYNTQYVKAMAVFEEIAKLKEDMKKQQALNRWDSI